MRIIKISMYSDCSAIFTSAVTFNQPQKMVSKGKGRKKVKNESREMGWMGKGPCTCFADMAWSIQINSSFGVWQSTCHSPNLLPCKIARLPFARASHEFPLTPFGQLYTKWKRPTVKGWKWLTNHGTQNASSAQIRKRNPICFSTDCSLGLEFMKEFWEGRCSDLLMTTSEKPGSYTPHTLLIRPDWSSLQHVTGLNIERQRLRPELGKETKAALSLYLSELWMKSHPTCLLDMPQDDIKLHNADWWQASR